MKYCVDYHHSCFYCYYYISPYVYSVFGAPGSDGMFNKSRPRPGSSRREESKGFPVGALVLILAGSVTWASIWYMVYNGYIGGI